MEELSTIGIDTDSSGSGPVLHIPTEVCENIIDMLYSEFTQDTFEHIATLRSCALVCRAWRVRSQRMLFYLVQLFDSISLHRLAVVLDAAQHLRDYVYFVELTGYHLHSTTSIVTLFPVVFAGKLPKLYRVDITHLRTSEWPKIPRTPDPPKSRALPYIPLHPRFPAFLSSFTAISCLYVQCTTFCSFREFVQTLHGLTNLEELACHSISWITPGVSHPGADFAKQPDWTAGGHIRPPFAPKLRTLMLWNMDMYGAERLVWTRGPHLVWLELTVPLVDSLEDAARATGRGLDLSPCTGLQTLVLSFFPHFSMHAHAGFVRALFASWKPRRSKAQLILRARREKNFTRRGFVDVLRDVGTIAEPWLQALEQGVSTGDPQDGRRVQYRLGVHMCDWDAQEEWWWRRIGSCFPTWLELDRLGMVISRPRTDYEQWASEEQPPTSDTVTTTSQIAEVA